MPCGEKVVHEDRAADAGNCQVDIVDIWVPLCQGKKVKYLLLSEVSRYPIDQQKPLKLVLDWLSKPETICQHDKISW